MQKITENTESFLNLSEQRSFFPAMSNLTVGASALPNTLTTAASEKLCDDPNNWVGWACRLPL